MPTLVAPVTGFLYRRSERDQVTFRSSTVAILGLMGSAAMSVYPNLLASTLNPAYSLTICNAASSPLALRASLIANLFGMIGVIRSQHLRSRQLPGKVRLDGSHRY